MKTTGWRGVGNSVLVMLLAVVLAFAYTAVVCAGVLVIGNVWPASRGVAEWAVVWALVKADAGMLWVFWVTRAWGLDLVRRRP